jgi:hypothetical protein
MFFKHMINTLIVFIHSLIILFTNFYVFYTKNNKYDYLYLTYVYFLILHWAFLNGDCIITIYYNKILNNDKENKKHDLYFIFGKYITYLIVFFHILMIINIYMVANRNNIKDYIIFIFILLFLSCSFCKYYFTDHDINTNFKFFNNIIKISLIYFGLYILYSLPKEILQIKIKS